MEKSGESKDNVIEDLFSSTIPFVWISSKLASADFLSQFDAPAIVKINDNFMYCHFLFTYVSDIIDSLENLSIHYYAIFTITNIKLLYFKLVVNNLDLIIFSVGV